MAYVNRFKRFLDQNGGLSSNAKRYRNDGYAQSGILMNYELSTVDVGTYIYTGTIAFCIVIALSLPILVVCSKSFSRYRERVRERKILNNTDEEYESSSIQNDEKKGFSKFKGKGCKSNNRKKSMKSKIENNLPINSGEDSNLSDDVISEHYQIKRVRSTIMYRRNDSMHGGDNDNDILSAASVEVKHIDLPSDSSDSSDSDMFSNSYSQQGNDIPTNNRNNKKISSPKSISPSNLSATTDGESNFNPDEKLPYDDIVWYNTGAPVGLWGANSFCRASIIMRSFDYIIDLADWNNETRRIIDNAITFTSSSMITVLSDTVAFAIMARYIGYEELAAYAIVRVLIGISDTFKAGILSSQSALCFRAIDFGNDYLAGAYAQLSFFFYFLFSLPIMTLLQIFMVDIFMALGLSENIAKIGYTYASVALYHNLFDGMSKCFFQLYSVMGHERLKAYMNVFETVCGTVLIAIAVIHFRANLVHIAYIQWGISFVFSLTGVMIAWKTDCFDSINTGLYGRAAIKNTHIVRKYLKTTIPLCIESLLSYGEWEVLTLLAARLGVAEVIAWSIICHIWSILENTLSGIAKAGSIRIFYHLENGNVKLAKESANKTVLFSVAFSFLLTACLFVIGEDIGRTFTHAPILQEMINEQIPLIGVANMVLSYGMVSWYILCAQGRTRLSIWVYSVCVWGISLPVICAVIIRYRIGLQAITASVIFGYGSASLFLGYFALTSDWDTISEAIMKVNERGIAKKHTRAFPA